MAETDKEFVSRMEDYFDAYCGIPEVVCTRLLTLARRGAAAGELLEALRWIDQQRYEGRETVYGQTGNPLFEAYGRLNRHICALFDHARAALTAQEKRNGE